MARSGGRNLERPAPGAHRRAVSRPRPGRALELVLGILDAGKVVTEQDARANDEPCLARKAGQPGGNFALYGWLLRGKGFVSF